ncbi:hypothetical protein PIB30_064636 [Stylosanthes scabra]|uniref:Aminotransferase-like plant mobile domain-containing protein n=1 Tax=Stylosanthes scabra TaxID=79078 RepID=A0ABU6VQ21_9FABA|nr:hypothetical protein [Stylosanthes scabra]
MTLLLSWAYHRIPAYRPDGFEQRHFPLAERWIGYEPPRDREETRLRGWRRTLNRLGITDVDRVVRQFGSRQHIPSQPLNIDEMHVHDGRWGRGEWYPEFLQGWYEMWRGRAVHQLPLDLHPDLRPSQSYLEWYIQWANLVLVGQGDEQDQLVQHVPLGLPVYDLPAPQLHQPEDGHLPEVRPRGGRQIRVRNRKGGRAGRGGGQGPEQEPAQEPPVQDPPVQDPPVQEPPVQQPPVQDPPKHPSEAGPSHGSPTDWYQSFIGDPHPGPSAQAGSSAQAVACTPSSFQAPLRIDDTTSSESASHGDLRGSMRPYMSDTSSDTPVADPPQGRGRRVRRPPDCGTGGCLEAPPARRGMRGGRRAEWSLLFFCSFVVIMNQIVMCI